MLQFVCDYCSSVKQPEETWVTGLAVENVGTQAARREVVIDSAWRRERAVLPMAVHFCSLECKHRYLAELFDHPVPVLEISSVESQPGRRVIRARKKPASEAVHKRTVTRKARTR